MSLNPILAFNGPPLAGKTSIANELMLTDPILFGYVSPTEILRDALTCLAFEGDFLNVDLSTPESKADQMPCVEKPFTVRQAICSLSDCVRKWDPLFLAKRCCLSAESLIDEGFEYIIYDNMGIDADTEALLEAFPKSSISVIQISRDGCEFNDSIRKHIEIDGCHTIEVKNNGDLKEAAGRILIEM